MIWLTVVTRRFWTLRAILIFCSNTNTTSCACGRGTALDGGRKFDLTRFNQTYFDRLRSRVVEAGQHGIYVSVMLFQGFSSQRKNIGGGNPWTGHPFNVSNKINGINGDPSGNDNGEEVHCLIVPAITSPPEPY